LLRYGKPAFRSVLDERWFTALVGLTLLLSNLLVYGITVEFEDFIGRDTAFRHNLMMSILF
jgi:hypothetical protein